MTAGTQGVRITVIVNAAAGAEGSSYASAELTRHFKAAGVDIEIKSARTGADIVRHVQQAIIRRPKMVVVGGGDGTLNAAASILSGTDIALGILPLGTLNHFAKDLPMDLGRAAQTIVADTR